MLSGTFFLPVKPDDSTWELEDAEAACDRLCRVKKALKKCADTRGRQSATRPKRAKQKQCRLKIRWPTKVPKKKLNELVVKKSKLN